MSHGGGLHADSPKGRIYHYGFFIDLNPAYMHNLHKIFTLLISML
jgi:hypothetical protein